MQAIREGDLYFLDSPLHIKPYNETTAAQEKRLSYVLGTVSSRPAVVVRAPAWWDRFKTVTVIPALHNGNPAMTFRLTDRYGNSADAEAYPFLPHNPHTVPISRLGSYLGSMDPDELEELLYAFHWIHDPNLQRTKPVPRMYRDVYGRVGSDTERDGRLDVSLDIDPQNMCISTRNGDFLDGFPLASAVKKADAQEAARRTVQFHPIPTKDPCPVAKEEPKSKVSLTPAQKAELRFPESIFDHDTLCRVAYGFRFDESYYDGSKIRRDYHALSPTELREIQGALSDADFQIVLDLYMSMKPMDAIMIGPRLPMKNLSDIVNLPINMTGALKRLCNTTRDLSQEDYDARMKALEPDPGLIPPEDDTPVEEPEEVPKEEKPKPQKPTPEEKAARKEMLEKLRDYMNAVRIMELPDDMIENFMSISMGEGKRMWSGTNFKDYWTHARTYYKTILQMKDANKAVVE